MGEDQANGKVRDSKRNKYLELTSWQITGTNAEEAGVYLRDMIDRDQVHHYDLRYFGFDPITKNFKPTPYGVKLGMGEAKVLVDLLAKLVAK